MNNDPRSDEELNRIIAEWMGWTDFCTFPEGLLTGKPPSDRNKNPPLRYPVESYCSDLNAMREAVMEVEDLSHYNATLERMFHSGHDLSQAINATARQRAEALVKVIENSQ